MPDTYPPAINLNNHVIARDENILFYTPGYDPEITVPCITPELFKQPAVKNEWQDKVSIQIPRAGMAYRDPSRDPPERRNNI